MATNESLNDILSPAIAATSQPGTGVQGGLGAADKVTQIMNQQQDLQMKQQKQQEMQQQLQTMKWNSTKGMLNTYMNASDAVRRPLKKQLGPRLMQNGADPLILNALDDEGTEANTRLAMDAMSNDPDQAAKGMAAVKSHDVFSDSTSSMADLVKERSQLQASQNLKEAQMANAQAVAKINAQGKVDAAGVSAGPDSPRIQRMNESVHQNAINSVTKNTGAEKALQSSANLQMALNNFENSGHAHEEFNQLQQAVRANTGISGSSTGVERANAYLNDLGMKGQGYAQFLTGGIQDVEKSSPEMVDLVRKLAARDITQKQQFAAQQLKPAVTGHVAFYNKPGNEGRKSDFEATVNEKLAQNGYSPDFKLGQPITFQHLGVPVSPNGQPAPQGAAPAAGGGQGAANTPTPGQQAFIAKAKQLINPQTKQPYSDQDIQGMMLKKGIK